MNIIEFYHEFRDQFPELTRLTDNEHLRHWEAVDDETAYVWFESLANVMNTGMHKRVAAKNYEPMLEYLRSGFLMGDEKVKNCIEVSFVENLFWQVEASKARQYWLIFPALFKDLYLQFHARPPA